MNLLLTKNNIFLCLFLFIISYYRSGSMIYACGLFENIKFILFICPCIAFIDQNNKSDKIFLIVWLITFILNIINYISCFNEVILFFSLICFSYNISFYYKHKTLKIIFINFMVFSSLIAGILFLINNYFISIDRFMLHFYHGTTLSAIGFIYNYNIGSIERNSGPFWEPGIFASWISIALLFLIFDNKIKNKTIYCLLLLFGLLTTYSGGGVLFLFLLLIIFIYKYFEDKKIKKNLFYINIIIFLMILFFILVIFPYINFLFEGDEHFDKITLTNLFESSRFMIIYNYIDIFKNNILVGKGINYLLSLNTEWYGGTSSIFLLSAAYGIFGFSYIIGIIYGIITQNKISFSLKIYIIIFFIAIINHEPHCLFCWTWIFIFCLLKNKNFFTN